MKAEEDWREKAGLKEKSKPKLLDNIAKNVPTPMHLFGGGLMIVVGMIGLSGGGIALQATSSSEPVWMYFDELPAWICWLVTWLGFDTMVFKERATAWILRKFVTPAVNAVLKATVGEERLRSWSDKLEKRFGERKENESSERDKVSN